MGILLSLNVQLFPLKERYASINHGGRSAIDFCRGRSPLTLTVASKEILKILIMEVAALEEISIGF